MMIDSDFVLYRMWDSMQRLLYIGRSVNSRLRLVDHAVSKDWWRDIKVIEFERFLTVEELIEAEAEAIRTEGPIHNIAGNSFRKQIEAISYQIDEVNGCPRGTSLKSIYWVYDPPEWCTPREFEIVLAIANRDLEAYKAIKAGVPINEAFKPVDQKFWHTQ